MSEYCSNVFVKEKVVSKTLLKQLWCGLFWRIWNYPATVFSKHPRPTCKWERAT